MAEGAPGPNASGTGPIAIKLVIVTMFDPPAAGWPSELRRWVERMPLEETLPFPLGERALRLDRAKGALAVVTGVGNTKAAATIMALGLDPRFDLSRAYWLVAGIAGANPRHLSVGSAAWVDWVVDGDLAHDIDPREIPASWPTGRLPLGKSEPYQQPPSTLTATLAYRLDPGLVDWAYALTNPIALDDAPVLAGSRSRFGAYPEARRPPFIAKGAVLAGNSLWHGKLLNDWADGWVAYWTEGRSRFLVSAMEDAGIAMAFHALARAEKVAAGRLLILRTVSNYTLPGDGLTAAASLADEMRDGFSGAEPALEAAFRVGSAVAAELTGNWDRYAEAMPNSKLAPSQPARRP
jgi:purine nucleoside permease